MTTETVDFAQAREHMVLSQLHPSGVINSAVLDAFLGVPRELFVPKDMRSYCYADDHLPLAGGRILLEPLVFAKMLESARIKSADSVLCIGGTTGYGAVVVAQLAAHVIDLECDDNFGTLQRDAVEELGVGNVMRVIGDFHAGAAARGPYDVILLEGAVVDVPTKLFDQLKSGGRLIAPLMRERAMMGQITLFEKPVFKSTISPQPLFDAYCPYLPGCSPLPRFAFN